MNMGQITIGLEEKQKKYMLMIAVTDVNKRETKSNNECMQVSITKNCIYAGCV